MATNPKKTIKGLKPAWKEPSETVTISRSLNPDSVKLKAPPVKKSLDEEVEEVPRLHVCGFEVQKLDNGLLGKYTHPAKEEKGKVTIAERDEIKFYPDYPTLLSRMVEHDVFQNITDGFDTKRDYKIIILSQQDPVGISDEEKRKRSLAAILEQGRERFPVTETPTKRDFEDDKIIYTAERLQSFKFRELLDKHGLNQTQAAEIAGMPKAAMQQALFAMKKKTPYPYRRETSRIAFTKLAKHFQKIGDFRSTTQGRLDRAIEKITIVRDEMRRKAEVSKGAYIPAEQFNQWASQLDKIINAM